MLTDRLRAHVQPMLEPDEAIVAAMAGFRPISRTAVLAAVFTFVLLGFAVSAAADLPSWVGGAVGGGAGAGVAMWLDQRRARAEHGGKGMGVGLVVTTRRLFVLELVTGPLAASVAGVEKEGTLGSLQVETERMQGSGLKRTGTVVTFADGEVRRVIPARVERFLEAMALSE